MPAAVTFSLYPSSGVLLSAVSDSRIDFGSNVFPSLIVVLYPVGVAICMANCCAIFFTSSLPGIIILIFEGKIKAVCSSSNYVETGCGIREMLLLRRREALCELESKNRIYRTANKNSFLI